MSDSDKPWVVENYGPQSTVQPPVTPPRGKRRPWLIPVIVGGSIAIVALIVAGFWAIGSYLFGVIDSAPQYPGVDSSQPLTAGEPGSPVAVFPLECTELCFDDRVVEATIPRDGEFARIGVPDNTFPFGTYDPVTAGELHRSDAASWAAYDGTPDACIFAPTNAPHTSSLDDESAAASADLVYFTGTHEDADLYNTVDQSVRIFADSASAEAFMLDLSESIIACDVIEIGPERDRHAADVTPAAALIVPNEVAAVGWIREGTPGVRWRAYVFDIQHANIIVRTRLLTDGSITEARFRGLVEELARDIAVLEPTAPE